MNETWFPNRIYYVGIGKEILSWEWLEGEKKDLYIWKKSKAFKIAMRPAAALK